MAWFYLIVGGLLEIVWATGLKLSEGFTQPVYSLLTLLTIVVSFYFFGMSMKLLPIGTAYAVYTGIGAAGAAIIGMIFFHEPFSIGKLIFLLVLISGILGLKLVDAEEGKGTS
ncbi:multidrug transporter [Bacillus coahuilensis m2-6]|uniref:Multidrug transporter n=1 Tax=Bacillus coahuilensis p1.1.43 TaxID=1150625 RepID=A0A147KC97_9BACI|nr:multidrug efflux SMR transporter [Bacillus coahuilensis]KUP09238.1 multidrug transporter [Bacillus coahuilensis p1.1.43]KUP09964.1 multidrug transporter [Bacillus coahuilensis m2-6]